MFDSQHIKVLASSNITTVELISSFLGPNGQKVPKIKGQKYHFVH